MLANLADYLGAVASWWGALIVVVIGFIVAKLRGRAPTDAAIPSHLRPLLFWSALFPVAFFGVASLRTHVEANWPAAYTVGACAFLASYAARHARLVLVCSAVNVLVLVVVTLHARAPFHASNSDRVLKETRGYRELAELVGGLDGPVFVDRHQTGGLLRFYLPNREITQWPGLTRPSELVRRPEWQSLGASDLAARGSFLLVTASGVPRGVEGFHASEMRRITVRAVDGRVETTIADAALPLSPSDTGKSFHRWHVTRYVVDEPPTTR